MTSTDDLFGRNTLSHRVHPLVRRQKWPCLNVSAESPWKRWIILGLFKKRLSRGIAAPTAWSVNQKHFIFPRAFRSWQASVRKPNPLIPVDVSGWHCAPGDFKDATMIVLRYRLGNEVFHWSFVEMCYAFDRWSDSVSQSTRQTK